MTFDPLGPVHHIIIIDDDKAYHKLIPENQTFTGNDFSQQTIENHDDDTGHAIA